MNFSIMMPAIVVITHDINHLGNSTLDEVAAPYIAVDARIAQKPLCWFLNKYLASV